MARPSITQLPPTGLDRFRGWLTRADDLTGGLLAAVPGIGTLAALNRSGNAAQAGNYTKAVESLTDVVPVGRFATKAIKGLTKGRSTGDVGGVLNIRAPQQDALDLAQKRAALPVSEGGLGLPPDNTPMDRARAMGFDVDFQHGSSSGDIQSIDINRLQASDPGYLGRALYGARLGTNAYTGGGVVYPLVARSQEMQRITPQNWNINSPYQEMADISLASSDRNKAAIDYAERKLSSGIKGIIDEANGNGVDQIAVFDPSQIRSRFAAFDPFRRNENDLLAFRGNMASSNLLNINPLLGLLDYENQ